MPRSILIVDDNDINRQILRKLLEDDYELLEAENGKEALEVMHRKYKLLSAVLLDLVMPVMDGYQVLEQVRDNAALAQIPIIVTTATTEAGAEQRALALGANDYLAKPYDPVIIKHRLRNTIKLRETASTLNALQRDRLTGLYNRAAFFDKAAQMIRTKERGHYVMGCFDVNSFKVINDQYGTEKGDKVLQMIAQIFRVGFEPEGGICCRISADNFAVLYPKRLMDTELLAEIRHKASVLDGSVQPLTFSIGRYIVDDLSLPVSAMYDRAILAKNTVKGQYDVHIAEYDEYMREHLLHEQKIVTEMNDALAGEQFEVWLQPQFNHATGALVGAEALVRWNHPDEGILVPPGDFVPIFERNGFIYELDKYIWEKVCALLKRWRDEGREQVSLSVNVSRYDIFQEDFFDFITGLIAKYGLATELLRLEITETAFAKSSDQIIPVVKQLIDFGFTVEIDDFGSGYSSLNTLKDVPANGLKLDMRFLENAEDSQRGGNVLESVVRMAKWLGMSVIAEGVETEEQADFLKSIGCPFVQGFLYARPMPVKEFEELAAKSAAERRRAPLETIDRLDSNAFWDPGSMETLIFNSYVGGACIIEYHNGKVELLRVNDKYAQTMGLEHIPEGNLSALDPAENLDEQNMEIIYDSIRRAIETNEESSCEVRMTSPRDHSKTLYIRSSMRVIARTSDRWMLYCSVTNVTSEREGVESLRVSEELFRIAAAQGGRNLARYDIKNNTYYNESEIVAALGFGEVIENMPEAFIEADIVSPSSIESYLGFYDKIRRGESCCTDIELRAPDGKYRWNRGEASVVLDEDGQPSWAVIVFYDITEQLEKEAVYRRWQQSLLEKLPETYTLYRSNLSKDTVPDSVEGSLLKIKFGKGKRFNARTQEYMSKYVYPDDCGQFSALLNSDALLANYYRGRRVEKLEYREMLEDGDYRWLRVTAEMVEFPNSNDIEVYLMFEDIDAKKRAQLRAAELAENDPLTGVLNRAAFTEKLDKLIAETKTGDEHALLMLDVDSFKQLNDSLGHAVGDKVLVDVANILRSVVRRSDFIGRIGGDEFLVCLKNVPDDAEIKRKASQIGALLRKSLNLEVKMTVSIGIAVYPRDGITFDELYRNADAALYYVKGAGKDNFAFQGELGGEEEKPAEIRPRPDSHEKEARRRMLIVDDNKVDRTLLASMFKDNFLIETADGGEQALTLLRHFGSSITVMLLDLVMPRIDGFTVLEKMRADDELKSIPVIVVSGDDERETSLKAIRCGAADYITKPVDIDLIRLRVQSAISRAENERLRAQNTSLSLQNAEITRYRTALVGAGTAVIEYDWLKGEFHYDPLVKRCILGTFDNRGLWRILLSDMAATSSEVHRMQTLVHEIADGRDLARGSIEVTMKTPNRAKHRFILNVYKLTNEFELTDKLILTFNDLDADPSEYY